MYSIQNDSSYDFQQQEQLIFHNRQMIRTTTTTKRQVFYSKKFDHYKNKSKDKLPIYRTPCTFEKNIRKEDLNVMFGRSPLISFCVPDVYSPGSNSKCSLPPPSSHLPPPPSEWLT